MSMVGGQDRSDNVMGCQKREDRCEQPLRASATLWPSDYRWVRHSRVSRLLSFREKVPVRTVNG